MTCNLFSFFFRQYKKIIISCFFKKVCRRFKNKGWVLLCNPPKSLNLAMPEFSIFYFVSFFPAHQKIHIFGEVPYDYVYFSFYLYNDQGQVIGGINHWNIQHLREKIDNNHPETRKTYCLRMGIEFPIPCTSYCLIYRVYSKYKIFPLPLPRIHIEKKEMYHLLPNSSIWNLKKQTWKMTPLLQKAIKRRNIPDTLPYRKDFFVCPKMHDKDTLFINPDATYFAVMLQTKWIHIRGNFPSWDDDSIVFSGFIVCNAKTTETIACFTNMDLERSTTSFFEFYVVPQKTMKKDRVFFSSSQKIIFYSCLPEEVLIIYREISKKSSSEKELKKINFMVKHLSFEEDD